MQTPITTQCVLDTDHNLLQIVHWKLNTTVLVVARYVDDIETILQETKPEIFAKHGTPDHAGVVQPTLLVK